MTYKFDASKPCVFAKDRPLFDGKPRKAGEPVPAGYSKAKLITWYAAGIIKNSGVDVVTEPEVPEVPEAATAPTGTPATLDNLGMGWYNVVVEGLGPVNPSKLKGKAAALAWAAENNYLTGE